MQVEDRLLTVIRDGEPVGKHAGTLVEKAIHTGSEKVPVVGLGVGINTHCVERYYPPGRKHIPVDKIGHKIASGLQKVLRKIDLLPSHCKSDRIMDPKYGGCSKSHNT